MSQNEDHDVSNVNAAPHAEGAPTPPRIRAPLRQRLAALATVWPIAALVLGGVATLAWVLALAYLVLQSALWLLGLD